MKGTMTVTIVTLCLTLSVLIILTVNNYATRKNEIEETLSVALDQSMEALKVDDKGYTPEKYEELVSDILQQMIFQVNSDCDLKINILTVDLDNGVVDIEAVAYYKWGGTKRNVSVRRTIILEEYEPSENNVTPEDVQKSNEPPGKIVHVRFMSEGILHNEINVAYGDPVPKPSDPGKTGWAFVGWYVEGDPTREPLTDEDWEDLCPSEDITFVAKYAAYADK